METYFVLFSAKDGGEVVRHCEYRKYLPQREVWEFRCWVAFGTEIVAINKRLNHSI